MLLLERGELTYLRRTLAMATTMPAVLTAMLTSMRVRGRCCAEMPPRVACKGVRHGRGGACERARTWGQVADKDAGIASDAGAERWMLLLRCCLRMREAEARQGLRCDARRCDAMRCDAMRSEAVR